MDVKLSGNNREIFKASSLWRLLKIEKHVTLYVTFFSLVTLALDYLTGPHIRFPILFAFPVVFMSFYRPWYLGAVLAVVLSILSLGLAWYWRALLTQTLVESIINMAVRILALGCLAYFTGHYQRLLRKVRLLSGILPICSFCKKIRDPDGNWQVLEHYIHNHSEAKFSHGFCPSCTQEHYGKYLIPNEEPQSTSSNDREFIKAKVLSQK
jgi:hypothetical protein